MKITRRPYLDAPGKRKYPVGRIAGIDSHTYNGSHVIHKLVEHLEQDGKGKTVKSWTLACRPAKQGIYSYMGFRVAITCQRCKSRDASGSDSDDR